MKHNLGYSQVIPSSQNSLASSINSFIAFYSALLVKQALDTQADGLHLFAVIKKLDYADKVELCQKRKLTPSR